MRCIGQLVMASGNACDDTQTTMGAVLGASMDLGAVQHHEGANSSQEEETVSAEWKYTTLVRLRKFLRRQYRVRKNKVVDSVSNTSAAGEDMADERAQLQQLSVDIKSIEFEIRHLSNSKTAVHGKHGPVGSVDSKPGNEQGDSARSQKDTVKRLLGSAGSLGGGSGSRVGGLLSGERLAELYEGDELDGEDEGADQLRGVRRNLLELYEDAQQEAPGAGVGKQSHMDDHAPAHPGVSVSADEEATAPSGDKSVNLKSVDAYIEAIKSLGTRARTGEFSQAFQQAGSTAGVAQEEVETSSSPCKVARLERQMEQHSGADRAGGENETNCSPCKVSRLARKLEMSDLLEHENDASPSQYQAPSASSGQAVPVPLWEIHTEEKSAAVRDKWSDVDLARWAAVNRGTTCPSPVPVVLAHRPVDLPRPSPGEASLPGAADMLPPLPAASTGARRRLEATLEVEDNAIDALTAKKFLVLVDKDAALKRAATQGTDAVAPVAVGKTFCFHLATIAFLIVHIHPDISLESSLTWVKTLQGGAWAVKERTAHLLLDTAVGRRHCLLRIFRLLVRRRCCVPSKRSLTGRALPLHVAAGVLLIRQLIDRRQKRLKRTTLMSCHWSVLLRCGRRRFLIAWRRSKRVTRQRHYCPPSEMVTVQRMGRTYADKRALRVEAIPMILGGEM